jgi:hypothetical protein
MKKEYFTTNEIAQGLEGLPPINIATMRNLRLKKRIRYTKVGNECMYKKEWIQEYLDRNEVQPIKA